MEFYETRNVGGGGGGTKKAIKEDRGEKIQSSKHSTFRS
jgi:hypothetical protein